MKRKENPSSFFGGQKWLIIEDGGLQNQDITSLRASMLVKKAKENGVRAADIVKATSILGGNKLTSEERDTKVSGLTHLIISKNLGVKLSEVMQGLRLPADQVDAPSFLALTPEWVTYCLLGKKAVDPTPYVLSEAAAVEAAAEGHDAKRARMASDLSGAASSAGAATGSGSGSAANGKSDDLHPALKHLHVGASREVIEARLRPYVDLDPATREAFIAWGGPVVVHKPRDYPTYACQRPAPRLHLNRNLSPFFEQLEEIYAFGKGDRERAVAFGRALAVIRGWPKKIASGHDLNRVRHIGQGMKDLVDEILTSGQSTRLKNLQAEPQVPYLMDLCRVHQVAHSTARKWLDLGYTSVAQILEELKGAPEGDHTQTAFFQTARPTHEQTMGLLHFEDYIHKMSRQQVEGIAALVREAALKALKEKGFGPETLLLEVCGGYRRGKEENGDADILISCTQAEGQVELRETMKRIMTEKMGLDIVFLKEGGVEGYGGSHTTHEKLTAHDNMLTLLKYDGMYRRVDFISCPPDQWWFCVLGWTGTKQMEKDLRDYADSKGLQLSQQAVFRNTKRLNNPKSPDGIFHSEEEIWEFLDLRYIPPVLRWA